MKVNQSQQVRDHLKKIIDADPEAKVNSIDLSEALGFKTADIFVDLKKSLKPVITEIGKVKAGGKMVKEYKINADGDFKSKSPVKFSHAQWIAERNEREERLEIAGQRLFAITCQKWPFTVSRRVSV